MSIAQERRRGSRTRSGVRSPIPDSMNGMSPETTPPVASAAESAMFLHRRERVWVMYGVIGVLLLAYVISLIVRTPAQQWTWLDGWCLTGLELVASLMCIYRGLQRQPGRLVPLILGFSLLSWTIGDFVLTGESLGGANVPDPVVGRSLLSDLLPTGLRRHLHAAPTRARSAAAGNWLDGVVAGLGAAALCAAFAFHGIQHVAGRATLARPSTWPIRSVTCCCSLVIGGTVLLSGRGTSRWYLMAVGFVVIVVGDTFNLFSNTVGPRGTRFGSDFNNIAWPTAILCMSMSVWLPSSHADPLREQKPVGFLLPGLALGWASSS